MPSIFSSFDPASNSLFSLNPSFIFWLMTFSMITLIFPTLWNMHSRLHMATDSLLSIPFGQSSLSQANHLKSFPLMLATLFVLISFFNLTGSLPLVFSSSSHFLFSMSYAFPIWTSLLISQTKTSSHEPLLLHSVPNGSPMWLSGPMVFIEFISNMIRPLTLGLRLAINMTAGHVMMSIIGQFLTDSFLSCDILSLLPLLAIKTGYMTFEFAIALVQTYIFCLLLSLYSNDHPS